MKSFVSWPMSSAGLFGPFIDKGLEGLLHAINKLLILHETHVNDVIDFILEIQKLLNHRLVFLWVWWQLCFQRPWDTTNKTCVILNEHIQNGYDVLSVIQTGSLHTLMYSIQCCRSTCTPPLTRLKSWYSRDRSWIRFSSSRLFKPTAWQENKHLCKSHLLLRMVVNHLHSMKVIPFWSIAVRCSPSSCFSTVAMRGFLQIKTNIHIIVNTTNCKC